ncbi:MAG TPA: NAD(P)-dependent oxidoreductase, partial [Vicinamibacterales bacterium]|nr:NAD(P)-dependent oxidoreductase [Vicinamibacterales bacterium]
MKPTVLLTRKIPASALAALQDACDVDYNDGEPLAHDELVERVRGKQGLVCLLTDTVDRAVLEAGTALKVVANVAVGYNNIDVAAARERGIIVTNTPEVLTEATADLTFALILDITRRVSEGDRLVRRGGWKGWALDFMLGMQLQGKQLGIIGYGRIGRAVGRRARAFGMRIAAWDPAPVADVEAMPLDRLLA